MQLFHMHMPFPHPTNPVILNTSSYHYYHYYHYIPNYHRGTSVSKAQGLLGQFAVPGYNKSLLLKLQHLGDYDPRLQCIRTIVAFEPCQLLHWI